MRIRNRMIKNYWTVCRMKIIINTVQRLRWESYPLLKCHQFFSDASYIGNFGCRSNAYFSTRSSLNSEVSQTNETRNLRPKIYVNAVCMELDKLILHSSCADEVLTLLVTHRGVYFIHNLITSLRVLANFSSKSNSIIDDDQSKKEQNFEDSHSDHPILKELGNLENLSTIQHSHHGRQTNEWIVRDERYEMMLQDIADFRQHLDFESIAHIVISLRQLNHKHYRLFGLLLNRLLKTSLDEVELFVSGFKQSENSRSDQPVQSEIDMIDCDRALNLNEIHTRFDLLLKCAECYVWVGYLKHQFYDHCANWLTMPIKLNRSDYVAPNNEKYCNPIERIHTVPLFTLDKILVIRAINLFGNIDTYNSIFFEVASRLIMKKDTSFFTSNDLSILSSAFSAHSRIGKFHDIVMKKVAEMIKSNGNNVDLRDLVKCAVCFKRMNLHFPEALEIVCNSIGTHLHLVYSLREKSQIPPNDICSLLEAISFFDDNSYFVREFCTIALHYIEDFIDEIDDNGAIQSVFTISVLSLQDSFSYLLSYMYRKIGLTTKWESEKYKVFCLWLCHVIQFPWLEHNLHPRCLYEGLRAWCLTRGGYGIQFPLEVMEVSNHLDSINVKHHMGTHSAGPYTLDIVLDESNYGKIAILVVLECSRNYFNACGTILLQKIHLKEFGYRTYIISLKKWRELDDQRKLYEVESLVQTVHVNDALFIS